MTPVEIAPGESPSGHDFACTRNYESDLALLNYLLQDLRALSRQMATGLIELHPHQRLLWEVHGLRRRTVVCDPHGLTMAADLHVVGFFGVRRTDGPADELERVELRLLDEFRTYPGILSYSSIELVDHHWANLVVHLVPDDREAWRGSETHVYAAESLAPVVYHNVRIHNGCLPGGLVGPKTIVIESTKYWDYDVEPTWHAHRALPHGATEKIESPDVDLI